MYMYGVDWTMNWTGLWTGLDNELDYGLWTGLTQWVTLPIYRTTYHNITTNFLNRTTPEIQRPHEYLYLVLMQCLKRSDGSAVGNVVCSACFGSLAG